MLISVSHDTIVSNKHEEQTRHYYVNFQHHGCPQTWSPHRGAHCEMGALTSLHAQHALDATPTMSTAAPPYFCGTEHQLTWSAHQKGTSSTLLGTSFATTGRSHKDVQDHITMQSMPAWVVEAPAMALKNSLKCGHAAMPYRAAAWQDFLTWAGLTSQYPNLIKGLTNSFHACILPLPQTFTPHNHSSINKTKMFLMTLYIKSS